MSIIGRRIVAVRAYIVEGGGADYHDQVNGHWIVNQIAGYLIISVLFCGCDKRLKNNEIVLENKSSIELVDKAVEIKRNQLPKMLGSVVFPLVINTNRDTIPSQLVDMDGDNKWDELFFVVNLAPKGSVTFSLKWSDREPYYQRRTSVRFGKRTSATSPVQSATKETLFANDLPKSIGFQRYQTDGPSWENDKVGFRHYLDGRNAKDLFGKKVSYMSSENVGINALGAVEDNYHVMEEWGRDILSVGNSVGIGGIAMMIGDSLKRLGVTVNDSINNVEETNFRIFSEGAVKSVINFQYKNWTVDERKYFVEETISIWPGMYAYNNKVNISGLQGDETLLVGLVNINTEKKLTEIKVNDKWVVLFTHDKQTYEKEWLLGLALILPSDQYLGFIEAPKSGKLSNTYLAKLKIENGKVLNYFSVAGWELSNDAFTDEENYKEYVLNLTKQLDAELKVSIR